jgi:membrane fusion protein (multidrug efflux system)
LTLPIEPETAGKNPEAHGEADAFDPGPFRPTKKKIGTSAIVAGAFFGGLLVLGIVPRVLHQSAMAEETRSVADELVRVRVVRVDDSVASSNLVLPGSVQPLQETPIYARANGFVRKWLVDIGAQVKKGQVLIELDVPDIDEELGQAQATANQAVAGIAQAKTQLELARTTNRRYGALGPSGVVSQQEVDQYQAGYDAQQSNVAAAEAAHGSAVANVRRLQDLKSFGVIVAPFDGVITWRNAEIGQLVSSGTGTTQPLYKVAEVDTVRVFVNVPQLYASNVKVGMDAPVTVRELAGRTFPGKVARTANELDTGTRSLLTEVDIPNPDNTLFAGMYGRVTFHMVGQNKLLFVPATAVVIDARGMRAAVVRDGTVHWTMVEIESDLGDKLAVSKGLAPGDDVIVAPSDRLIEGLHVRPESPSPPPAESKPKAP